MNNTEQYFRKFKLKAPSPNLKTSVVKNVEVYCRQQGVDNLPNGIITAVKIVFYSAAAAIVLMLSTAFFNMPEQNNNVAFSNKTLALLADIGLSREAAIRLISLEKLKTRHNNINLKTLTREI